jgi:hypothetical protein
MTTVKERATAKEPLAHAQLSPFPKIADYAFVSNCHTGALVGLTAQWIGCACRSSTRLACSAAQA